MSEHYKLAQLNSYYYTWLRNNEQKKAMAQLQEVITLHPSEERQICKQFGCGASLTLQERLAGDKCTSHSTEQPAVDLPKDGIYLVVE